MSEKMLLSAIAPFVKMFPIEIYKKSKIVIIKLDENNEIRVQFTDEKLFNAVIETLEKMRK